MDLLGLGHLGSIALIKRLILGQTQHVVDLVIVLAVPHDLIATKPRVPTHNDSHLWPRRSDLFDYSSQLWRTRWLDPRWPGATARTADARHEDIERQVAILGVIAMEIPPLLMTVEKIIGGIDVEHDSAGALG